jgi:hypothetical protein
MMGTRTEKMTATKLLGTILDRAVLRYEWLHGTKQYQYFDDTDKAAGDELGFRTADDLICTLWTKYEHDEIPEYLKIWPAIKSIRLRYERDPESFDEVATTKHEAEIAKPEQEGETPMAPLPIQLTEVWSGRFLSVAVKVYDSARSKTSSEHGDAFERGDTFLHLIKLELRKELGRDLILKSPHVVNGLSWISVLIIVLLSPDEIRSALKSIGFFWMNAWYMCIQYNLRCLYRKITSDFVVLSQIRRTLEVLISMAQNEDAPMATPDNDKAANGENDKHENETAKSRNDGDLDLGRNKPRGVDNDGDARLQRRCKQGNSIWA